MENRERNNQDTKENKKWLLELDDSLHFWQEKAWQRPSPNPLMKS
ncbi:hypothetical protein [Shewanella surugensis]|nr:hypothetical protein [Shewanella surugensis]